MLELTKEQMDAIQKAISKKAEESVQEFDKELDVVVDVYKRQEYNSYNKGNYQCYN